MALDDVPLEDAGRDYYAKQFGNRVKNIRKSGATPPPRNSGSRASGWAAGGGVVAVLVVIRIIVAVVVGVSGSNSSSYNNYNSYQSPLPPSTAPMDWNDHNMMGDPQPWQVPPAGRPDWQPAEPRFPPIPPVILDPNPLPPIVPDDAGKLPDKDD